MTCLKFNCIKTARRTKWVEVSRFTRFNFCIYLNQGDRIIYTFEIADEAPYLFECAPFKLESLHQGASFLPKYVCDVRKVEVARAWRLTTNSVEALSFTVPRVKVNALFLCFFFLIFNLFQLYHFLSARAVLYNRLISQASE